MAAWISAFRDGVCEGRREGPPSLADGRTGFRGRQVVRVAERTEEEEEDMWAIYYLLGA